MAESVDVRPDPNRRLIVGLGNPGAAYDGTRHNVGFRILDRLAQEHGLRFRRQERVRGLGPVKARVAELARAATDSTDEGTDDTSVLFVKPWTYMNLSGDAVAAYARFYGIRPESIFVIYDDLHLPLGRIRIRPGGSPGGHNGIKSLIACLGTEGFPRLRMGIAVTDLDASVMADPDFVLGQFSEEEHSLLEPTLQNAVAATQDWIAGRPLAELMSHYNAMQLTTDDQREEGDGPSLPKPSM